MHLKLTETKGHTCGFCNEREATTVTEKKVYLVLGQSRNVVRPSLKYVQLIIDVPTCAECDSKHLNNWLKILSVGLGSFLILLALGFLIFPHPNVGLMVMGLIVVSVCISWGMMRVWPVNINDEDQCDVIARFIDRGWLLEKPEPGGCDDMDINPMGFTPAQFVDLCRELRDTYGYQLYKDQWEEVDLDTVIPPKAW